MAQSHGSAMLGFFRALGRDRLIETLKDKATDLGGQLRLNIDRATWSQDEARACINAHVDLLTIAHNLTPHERCDIRKAAAQRAGVLDF